MGSPTVGIAVTNKINPGPAQPYRSGVNAADLLAPPTVGATSVQAGGSLAANTYNVKVVGVNAFGRTTATAGAAQTTALGNLTVRIPITALVGATAYDIYVSTDADPKWVGRITEAQRAAGVVVSGVGVTGAGGAAGAVDVQVVGTGQQAGTTAAVNTAYAIPSASVDCTGAQYCDFDLAFSATGDGASVACQVVPFYQNAFDGSWYQGDVIAIAFGGASGHESLHHRLRFECRGSGAMALIIASIAGTGVAVGMLSTLS